METTITNDNSIEFLDSDHIHKENKLLRMHFKELIERKDLEILSKDQEIIKLKYEIELLKSVKNANEKHHPPYGN